MGSAPSLGAVFGATVPVEPAGTEGLKDPAATGGVEDVVDAVVAGLVGFSSGMAGALAFALGLVAGVALVAVGVLVDAVVAPGESAGATVPGTTGGIGLVGFLLVKAALGSQSLFFLDSVASVSMLRFCILLLKGDGVLVTNTATAKAAAKPSTTPIIKPSMVPPR